MSQCDLFEGKSDKLTEARIPAYENVRFKNEN